MKHTEQYLQTILTKMLRTDFLNSFNENNPISQVKTYCQTSHVRINKKGLKYDMVEDGFSHEDNVSLVISKEGNLLVCFKESCSKGICVHLLLLMTI